MLMMKGYTLHICDHKKKKKEKKKKKKKKKKAFLVFSLYLNASKFEFSKKLEFFEGVCNK